MKTVFQFVMIWLLAATVPLWAKFESIKIDVTHEPQVPARLVMEGLVDGHVIIAIDVGPDGRLLDWLVLSASHRELIKPCVESLQRWRYEPARYDGLPVQARLEMKIDISMTGVVVSRNPSEMLGDFMERVIGRPFDYQICPVKEIDRQPVPVTTIAPRYATGAAAEGIHGRVKVHFFIDEKGEVRLPAVLADEHPYLASMAIEAMKGWKFEPPTRRGRPVLIAAVQEFDFGGVQ